MMDARSREKCLKEIRLLQSLNHPNIVRYIDSYIDNNELIIVLEFAEGGDLKGLIKRVKQANRVFEEAMIWNYAEQITAGLHHMHAKRIMHRDLKPAYATHLLPCVAFFLLFSEWETIFFLWQRLARLVPHILSFDLCVRAHLFVGLHRWVCARSNIMLTVDNQVKLGDLGLGRYFTSQTLEAFSKVGTPLYMSAEVLQGNGYTFSADVRRCQRCPLVVVSWLRVYSMSLSLVVLSGA